jgi:lipoprotein NlpI
MESRRYLHGAFFGLALLVAALRLVKVFHHNALPPEIEAALAAEKSANFGNAAKLYTKALNSNQLTPAVRMEVRRKRAFAYLQNGQPQLAIGDFSEVIQANPNDALALTGRALGLFKEGDYEQAVPDFAQALTLKQRTSYVFKNLYEPKGLAEFYLGRFEQAETDFRAAATFQPQNAYDAVWLYLAESRQRKDGSTELKNRALKLNLDPWPGPIVRLLLSENSPEAVMNAARTGNDKMQRDQLCEANYYFGEIALIAGDNTEATRRLSQASANCDHDFNEFNGAEAELKRLIH